jgi:aryl-alcohol dehydrogenase-like predicted oxidoreductase
MERRPLCAGGPAVAPLGFGAGHVGGDDLTEDAAGTLLNAAVDLGVNLIDTARGYGRSEERIGRHLSYRRDDVVLVSKCGYGIPGHADWTAGCITAGVDAALSLMRTDRIDAMLLHSCPRDVLERGEVVDALERAVAAGKVLFAGYSGENDDLMHAIESGRFRVVEASVNLADQRTLDLPVTRLRERGMGLIAKRPLANAPWRFAERPRGHYAEAYWERMQAMRLPASSAPLHERALRFAAFAPGVSCAIAGTASLANLRANVAAVERGPLPEDEMEALREAFRGADRGWTGQL